MGHALHDLIRHNSWANKTVLDFCRSLEQQQLDATVPGTYGTIIKTLRHTIGSESSYLYRITGAAGLADQREVALAGLEGLAQRAALLEATWEQFLAGDVDPERPGEARGDEGEVFAVPTGVFITQALHHGNEHRAHICTIVGALGLEAPEVSGWAYAELTGRMTLKTAAADA